MQIILILAVGTVCLDTPQPIAVSATPLVTKLMLTTRMIRKNVNVSPTDEVLIFVHVQEHIKIMSIANRALSTTHYF